MSTVNIKQRYEEYLLVGSDIIDHLPTFVSIAHDLGALRVIELGVRSGVSTVAWLYALQDQGEQWSVDLEPSTIDFGHPAHWHFVQGDDRDPQTLAQLPEDVDIVFIDTSHTYDHTRAELRDYGRRVRNGGLILLHDTEVEHPQLAPEDEYPYPVKRAISEYCDLHDLTWQNDERCNGLATIFV